MPDYVVSTVFRSRDEVSVALQRMSAQSKLFGFNASKDLAKVGKNAVRLRDIMGGILGASVIQRGIGVLRSGIQSLTEEFIDFDHSVTSAAAKWDIRRGTEQFEQLGRVARDVAKVTPYSAGQAGAGLDYLAMAGFKINQAMAALPGVTQLAIAANVDLAEASDIASDALSSLNMMTDKDAELKTNLTRINDVFAKTTVTANTNLQMLFEGMKEVAPVASNLGVEVETLSALMGKLANAGIKSTQGGTALRNMYLRLTGGTREVEKVLKKYNIQIMDSNGKMRSMIDVLDDVRVKTEKLNAKVKQAAYTHLFGTRAVAAATVLMKEGGQELHRYEASLYNASGAAANLAEQVGQSLKNRLAAMKSQLIEVGLKIFDTFEDDIPRAMDAASKAIQGIDVKALATDLHSLYTVLKDVLFTIRDSVGWLKEHKTEVELLTKAYISFKAVALGAGFIQGLTAVAGGFSMIGATIGVVATVAWMLYSNWENVSKMFQRDIQVIKNYFSDLKNVVFELIKLIPGVGHVVKLAAWGASKLGIDMPSLGKAFSEQRRSEVMEYMDAKEAATKYTYKELVKELGYHPSFDTPVTWAPKPETYGSMPEPGFIPSDWKLPPPPQQSVRVDGKIAVEGPPGTKVVSSKTTGHTAGTGVLIENLGGAQ